MFPFVGAPMFYSARRRKRKWTVVFAAEGAVAIGDVIGVSAAGTGPKGENEPDIEGAEGDEREASFSGGKEHGRRPNDDVASEADILLSSLVASRPASAELANVAGATSGAKKHRRRSSSQVSRGSTRHWQKPRIDRSRVPSHSSAEIHTDELAVSSLECLLEHCAKWNFDTFLLNRLSGGHAVVAIGCKMFETYQFHRVFQLDWTALLLCLRLIENGYRQNPYHNSVHAADVAQAMHCFLQEPPMMASLDPLEKMACILAAFGHDLYHPGVNQKFLEGSDHFLCQLYNRTSVLESFHWRCLVSIIKESSLFDRLSREQWQKFLRMLEVLILATDMQRQQEYLNQFKEFLSSHTSSSVMEEKRNRLRLMQPYLELGGQPRMNEADERMFVMQILIKCADISNPCRPWEISKEWSHRVAAEFFNQGDAERRLKLPVTSFCDRYATSVSKIQSGFMEYVAQPLFADWDQYMRSPLSSFMLRNLRINCQNWNKALRDQVQQQELSQQQQQQQQAAHTSSPSVYVGGLQPLHQQGISAASSLEEMADLEMQKPDVLKRRASSSAVPRSFSPRSSLLDQPRRVSLPVTVGSGATMWTASANRRMYEAISTSDIANSPIRLRLSHSEVAEESDDDECAPRHEAIKEGEEEDNGKQGGEDDDELYRSGACSGSGCGTPTPPPPSIVVSAASAREWPMDGDVYPLDKQLASPQQQERRFSEPLVLTISNFCAVSSRNGPMTCATGIRSKHNDESGLFPNLMFLQRCMPRRGSLPMTQKELEDAQAISNHSLEPPGARGNSSVPEAVAPLGRSVGVS